jgi:hypothetical protein
VKSLGKADGIKFSWSIYKTVYNSLKMSLKKLPDLWQLFWYKMGFSKQQATV